MVDSNSEREESASTLKRSILIALGGASFFVFVLGSFVFAYVFLYSTVSRFASIGEMGVPRIGNVPLLPNIPGMPTPTKPDGAEQPATATKKRINFLLLGIDQRDNERGVPTRSDTMMVVSVDQVNKTAAMISLARDLWVEIPTYADNRINVANFLGDAYKYPGGGPALAMKTVERNFGLEIDYYARIDFRGFEKIVDTLGGIDIDVPTAIVDYEYPTEDYETMVVRIPAGRQHMNGKVALQYARTRHQDSDFGRARRQQQVMLAIRDRAIALDVIPKLPSLMSTLWNMVQTDIPPAEFLRLAMLAKEIDSKSIGSLVVDDKLSQPYKGEGGADLLLPNKPEIRKAIGALLADPVIKNEAAKIEVINGTSTVGLATKTGEFLAAQGYNVVKVSSGDRTDYKQTQIVLTGDKKGTASLLASTLKVSSQAIVPGVPGTDPSIPDIRVILGQDFALPQ